VVVSQLWKSAEAQPWATKGHPSAPLSGFYYGGLSHEVINRNPSEFAPSSDFGAMVEASRTFVAWQQKRPATFRGDSVDVVKPLGKREMTIYLAIIRQGMSEIQLAAAKLTAAAVIAANPLLEGAKEFIKDEYTGPRNRRKDDDQNGSA
jgi:hypothetical protein